MTRVLPWLLLLAAAVLYGWRLGEMPTYVSPDEAIIAVDAHAIATTGRDVHGVAMPLYFFIQMPKSERSGWFTPVIFYLSAAVQLVLPFNEWSVRLPSVLVGLSNLALMFILVRGMFGSWPLALSASALLALSPAHYIFSRYALDYLYPVPFLIAWLVALRRALDAPTAGRLAAVGLFLGLGFYSYAAAVVLTPMLFLLSLLLLAGVVGDWKRLAPVAAGYLVPLILFAVWFAAHPDAFANTAQRYALYDSSRLNLLQGVREFLSGPNIERMVSIYWSFLSPSVLFLSGDQLITFSTRQAGVFPTALSLLMVLGLIQIIERERTRMAVAIVVAFLMAPIPAVLVPESGAVNRATAILPFGVLIATYGLKLLSSVRVITHARAIAIVVGSVALLLGVAYASWTLLSEGRLGGSAAGIVLLGAILATFAALSRGRAQGPLVAAAVLALIVVQFGRFAYDYHGDYRLRVNSWLGGNLRGALEALIDHLPPGSSSPVYFAHFQSSGGVADIRNYFMDAYWRFYLIKHRREDLLGRAVALEPGPITGVAPGSFVLGNLGDRQVDALIATGELKPVATFPELDRDPFFVLLEEARFMTSKKRILFTLTAVGLASLVTSAALLSVDVFLHRRFERSAGYNVWGYRGPSVGKKLHGETRIAMLGGSSAYGYGVTWDQAIPALLEQALRARPAMPPVSVVNLGYNNEGSYSLRFTLEDYRWLDYDLVVLYEGYNDLHYNPPEANFQVFRRESPVFRLTGYLPIFPIIFREKAAALVAGGLANAYSPDQKAIFRPGLSARGAAGFLNAAASVGNVLENQLGMLSEAPARSMPDDAQTGCAWPWTFYCRSMLVATDYALSRGAKVLVTGQPHLPPDTSGFTRHRQQQEQLVGMLQRKYTNDARVRYFALDKVVDVTNEKLSFDSMHLTKEGNQVVASTLADPVSEMIAQVRQ